MLSRVKIIVIVIFVCIVILLSWFYFQASKNPNNSSGNLSQTQLEVKSTADKFISYLTDKDAENTYNLFSDSLKRKITKEEWQSNIAFGADQQQGEPVFDSIETEENYLAENPQDWKPQKVNYKFSLNNDTYLLYIIVIKKDDQIRVSDFDSYKIESQ